MIRSWQWWRASAGRAGLEGCGASMLTRCTLVAVVAAFGAASASVSAADGTQKDFATPDGAATALVAAVRANDQQALLAILGPDGEKLIHSGDDVADLRGRQHLVTAYDKNHRVRVDHNTAALVVGPENWSLPIPIVRKGTRWQFDTVASAQKIIDRRVGRNELSVIQVCRAYVQAQREYAAENPLRSPAKEYAQKFESGTDRHDGLYWEAGAGQPQSPLGPLFAKARAQGYSGSEPGSAPTPYHGYYYRILTRQGAHAPGGARDYVVSGHMTAGFALLAFPARWGDSGIMTFIVNQDGIVFQKNLGPDTDQLAPQITEYDPDSSWNTP
ncbi:MAG TPA: DUF2950 domain-containing protein [Burkholderiaceae bacterium]|jgi:hypothetical protein|nr:DUF2950 domain-containing protein [Burkholderiaceae bacterium]